MASTSLADEAFQSLVEQLEDAAGGPTLLMLQVALYEPLGRLAALVQYETPEETAAVVEAAARSLPFTVQDEGRAWTMEPKQVRVDVREFGTESNDELEDEELDDGERDDDDEQTARLRRTGVAGKAAFARRNFVRRRTRGRKCISGTSPSSSSRRASTRVCRCRCVTRRCSMCCAISYPILHNMQGRCPKRQPHPLIARRYEMGSGQRRRTARSVVSISTARHAGEAACVRESRSPLRAAASRVLSAAHSSRARLRRHCIRRKCRQHSSAPCLEQRPQFDFAA